MAKQVATMRDLVQVCPSIYIDTIGRHSGTTVARFLYLWLGKIYMTHKILLRHIRQQATQGGLSLIMRLFAAITLFQPGKALKRY